VSGLADLILVAIVVAFFALATLYVRSCAAITRGDASDAEIAASVSSAEGRS
jgi:hypothetical protein